MANRSVSQGPRIGMRSSMDWPLSREEKKCQALHLYERDVKTCEDLLQHKDRALNAAKQEIKNLRRASTGSTITTTASSSPNKSLEDSEADDSDDTCSRSRLVRGDAGASAESQMPLSKPTSECKETKTAGRGRHPTSQRSNSLEVVSSWLPTWKTQPEDRKEESNGRAMPQRHNGRTASPHRQPGMRRSSSLETVNAWWGPAWKAMRNGAKRATETATETARILADEARILADEAFEVVKIPVEALSIESRSHDSGTGIGPSDSNLAKSTVATERIEWHVDFAPNTASVGLKLESSAHDGPPRVMDIVEGSALDKWNSSKVPVTVFLHPGRREAVIRRIAVHAGDELIAIDGVPLKPGPEDAENMAHRIQNCRMLSFQRNLPRRA